MNISKVAKASVAAIENRIQSSKIENYVVIDDSIGKVVVKVKGNKDSAKFDYFQRRKLHYRDLKKGIRDIGTHNHPPQKNPEDFFAAGGPLSPADIMQGFIFNFSEIRVVESNGRRHIMEVPVLSLEKRLKGIQIAEEFERVFNSLILKTEKDAKILSRKMRKFFEKEFPGLKFRTLKASPAPSLSDKPQSQSHQLCHRVWGFFVPRKAPVSYF